MFYKGVFMVDKYILFGDVHLGIYNDSELWLNIIVDFFKDVVKYSIENKIDKIIILGDFFDNRKSLNTKTQHTAHRIAKILKLNNKLHTYIIVGNHDCYYKNKIQPNTLELFKKYDNITIVNEIKLLVDDSILLVPWGQVPGKDDGHNVNYCFGHFAINGFHMNDSYKCKNGLDDITFKDFDMVLSGHFHSPSSNKNIRYLGSPYHQDFHDTGERGWYIFEEGKLDFVNYDKSPKFMKVYSGNDFGKDIEGNIIKLIFEKDYGTTKNQEIIDSLLSFKPLLYSIDFANIKSDENNVDDEDVILEDKVSIVNQYIEKQKFPENIKISTLKSMFGKIMKEAEKGKKWTE